MLIHVCIRFRREALKWHPDKNAGSDDASRRFVKIQAAYDVYEYTLIEKSDKNLKFVLIASLIIKNEHTTMLIGETLAKVRCQSEFPVSMLKRCVTGDLDESYDLRERAKQAATSKQAVRITAKHLMRFFDASLWNGDFSDDANVRLHPHEGR